MEEMFEDGPLKDFVVPGAFREKFEAQIKEYLRHVPLDLPGTQLEFGEYDNVVYYDRGERIRLHLPQQNLLRQCVLVPLDIDHNKGIYTMSVRCDLEQHSGLRGHSVPDVHTERFTIAIYTKEEPIETKVIDDEVPPRPIGAEISESQNAVIRRTLKIVLAATTGSILSLLVLKGPETISYVRDQVLECIRSIMPSLQHPL